MSDSSSINVTMVTKCGQKEILTKCGRKRLPLIGGLCHTADFNQMWSKYCPSSKDFITQRTLTKCGLKNCPSWEDLSHSGLQPNVVQILPLIGELYHTADFDQMKSKNCPLLEDFVTQRTLNKCGLKNCPSWEDFVTQQTPTK